MKNGSQGSAIAWATPARRAVRPSRSIARHLEPQALGMGGHVLHRDRPAEEALGRGRHRAADDRGGRLLGSAMAITSR